MAEHPTGSLLGQLLIASGAITEEDVVRSYNLHANCYVTKPVDLDQFIKVVKSVQDFWFSVVRLAPE